MITVEGQFSFKFDVGGNQDIFNASDLDLFALIEEAGNLLPTFSLAARVNSDSVLALLNEGQVMKVTMGPDPGDKLDVSLIPVVVQSSRFGENQRQLVVKGMLAATNYLNSGRVNIHKTSSALAAMKEVVSRNFKPDFIPEVSSDSQRWIQYGTSDRKFVSDTWLHADLTDSVPLVAITSDGRFKVRDLKKLFSAEGPRWVFTNDVTLPSHVPFLPGLEVEVKSGFTNAWFGSARNMHVMDWESGKVNNTTDDAQVVLAMTKDLMRSAESQVRQDNSMTQSENVHPNYWKSYLRNMAYLTSQSTVGVKLIVADQKFRRFDLLDPVMLLDDELSEGGQAVEFHSGDYVLTKVIRNLSGNRLSTILEMSREALALQKGNFR